MAEQRDSPTPREAGIKVKRQRRRIYQEPVVEEQPSAQEEPASPGPTPAAAPVGEVEVLEPAAAQEEGTGVPNPARDSEAQARRIIRRYLAWSMGVGLVPLPILDALAVGALQMLLIKDLARVCGVDYSAQRVRALLAALVGGTGVVSFATGLWASWLKALPVVGQSLGAATMPAAAGATTYAVGMVFLRHFQSGGTLLDFSPAHQAAEFKQRFSEGQREAAAQGR